ncbi:MAG: zinc-binding dehydrogenase [Acidimicrobiales bacterium]
MTGAREQDHRRLELARDFGADLVVDVLEEDPRAALKRATGGLADVVVDVTANAPAAFPQGIGLARPRPERFTSDSPQRSFPRSRGCSACLGSPEPTGTYRGPTCPGRDRPRDLP